MPDTRAYGEGREPIPAIDEPVVIFIITNSINDRENEYEATRASWFVPQKVRDNAVYALGSAHGVIKGAYRIDRWIHDEQSGRWLFEGVPAPELNAVDTSIARLRRAQGAAWMYFEKGIPAADL